MPDVTQTKRIQWHPPAHFAHANRRLRGCHSDGSRAEHLMCPALDRIPVPWSSTGYYVDHCSSFADPGTLKSRMVPDAGRGAGSRAGSALTQHGVRSGARATA